MSRVKVKFLILGGSWKMEWTDLGPLRGDRFHFTRSSTTCLQSKLTPADAIWRLARSAVAWRSGCDRRMVAVLTSGCLEGGVMRDVEKGPRKPI